MFAGRWSAEKRINLLWEVIPEDCALVIVGDGTAEFADSVENAGAASGRKNVLPLREMLNAPELRVSYAAADLFLSASAFETLGNTVVEAWCSGTPVAVQPAQGHLEFVEDGKNSWFVDYDKPDEARAKLKQITSLQLGADKIQKSMPESWNMGKKFRETDFPRAFDEAVIQPALEKGAKQKCRGCCCPCEIMCRMLCFIFFVILWIILRIFNRTVYILSCNPRMEVLGKLGGAVEDEQKTDAKPVAPTPTETKGDTTESFSTHFGEPKPRTFSLAAGRAKRADSQGLQAPLLA